MPVTISQKLTARISFWELTVIKQINRILKMFNIFGCDSSYINFLEGNKWSSNEN